MEMNRLAEVGASGEEVEILAEERLALVTGGEGVMIDPDGAPRK